jgi:hypothetical protein
MPASISFLPLPPPSSRFQKQVLQRFLRCSHHNEDKLLFWAPFAGLVEKLASERFYTACNADGWMGGFPAFFVSI